MITLGSCNSRFFLFLEKSELICEDMFPLLSTKTTVILSLFASERDENVQNCENFKKST